MVLGYSKALLVVGGVKMGGWIICGSECCPSSMSCLGWMCCKMDVGFYYGFPWDFVMNFLGFY